MKLHCQIEPSDYVRAQYLNLRPRPLIKWLVIILIAIFLLVFLHELFTRPIDRITALPFIVSAILVYLVITYGVWLPYRTKKIYKQQKSLQEPYDAELSQDEFISSNSLGTARIKWADFHKYKVAKDMILVYQSDLIFHMFPRRWFNEGEYEKLLEILKLELGEPKP